MWHGDDMAGAGRRRAEWNEALLQSAIAPAYAALIQEASQLLGPCADFWRLLPLGQGTVPQPWLQVAAALYARLASLPVMYSPMHGGCWLPARRALLPDAACYSTHAEAAAAAEAAGGRVEGIAGQSQQQKQPGDAAGFEDQHLGFVPPPQRPSFLALLMVQCGLPLVVGVSDEQQRCLLQWTPDISRLSPAAARKLLAANAQLVAQAIERHHNQDGASAGGGQEPPAAAVLLQYALSDVAPALVGPPGSSGSISISNHQQMQQQPRQAGNTEQLPAQLLAALRQLHTLKLLPLADGQVQSLGVGLHTQPASNARTAAGLAVQPPDTTVYIAVGQQEQQLLGELQHQVLHAGTPPDLQALLLQVAAAGVCNLHQVTAHRMDAHILPLLLPPSWRSSGAFDEVAWHPEQHQQQKQQEQQQHQRVMQPSTAFIRLLWQWLAERADAGDISHWPILPIHGGKLRLLKQPAQVSLGKGPTSVGLAWV